MRHSGPRAQTPKTTDFPRGYIYIYKFIRFGAIDITKPYRFIGFGAIDITKAYKFKGFGAIDITKPSGPHVSRPSHFFVQYLVLSRGAAPKNSRAGVVSTYPAKAEEMPDLATHADPTKPDI